MDANKLDKSLIYKNFKKDLIERFGSERAEMIWKYANNQVCELEQSIPGADSTDKQFVFPAVALFRAIDNYFPGQALELTRAYGKKTGLKMKKIFSRITALPGIPGLMWKNMDKIAAKMSDGYECKDVHVTDSECSLDVVGCPLYDRARKLGTPEAAQMICCMDKEYMTGFRGIDYVRTKSVAEGDDCCDYRLKKSDLKYHKKSDDKSTKMPDNKMLMGIGLVFATIMLFLTFRNRNIKK
ncbi:MAG: L-2-amino-thiazoline-4-carboxylic acid hydrolase [Eubacterium sp.]|nr:L-2-amino-thiazoline-4-carboxylic acid hydrolase [Eubacterium sp.]